MKTHHRGLQHRRVRALLREQIRTSSHLQIFPGFPVESTFCDQRHGNTTARPVALIHLSLGTTWSHLASPAETLTVGASSGRPPMHAYFLPQSSFLYQLSSIINLSFHHIRDSLLKCLSNKPNNPAVDIFRGNCSIALILVADNQSDFHLRLIQ